MVTAVYTTSRVVINDRLEPVPYIDLQKRTESSESDRLVTQRSRALLKKLSVL